MGSSVPAVYGLVNRALVRMRVAALGEALAAPAAGLLLAAAAVLAAARASGRADLPTGLLAACAALAAFAAAAKLARLFPRFEDAALHLDRSLAAGERFTTVVETAERDPAVAEWAARGALERATDEALRRALAMRPPAALLPLALAASVVAGLALLPAPPAAAPGDAPAATGPASAGGPESAKSVDRRSPAGAGAVHAPSLEERRAEIERLEAQAGRTGSAALLEKIAERREALARAEAEEARSAAGSGKGDARGGVAAPVVPGATGGGEASRGDGATPRESADPFRPFPVPLRAREAVRTYFGAPKKQD